MPVSWTAAERPEKADTRTIYRTGRPDEYRRRPSLSHDNKEHTVNPISRSNLHVAPSAAAANANPQPEQK
ncbi:MAG: hypothetical protein ACH37Z_16355, partial [Anaerolineae bacterium]